MCDQVLRTAAVALACEQVGGAAKVLETTVEYVKTREQFGRPIGSFQAVKHRLADMLVQLESARSAAYFATAALESESDEAPVAASIAKSYCSSAYYDIAAESIQLHGGIGFTWEHSRTCTSNARRDRRRCSARCLPPPTDRRRTRCLNRWARRTDSLRSLSVEPQPDGTYLGGVVAGSQLTRLFGGLVAQALAAAGASVKSRPRAPPVARVLPAPGHTEEPVRYRVESLRDGRAFTTHRVTAEQAGRPILTMIASFHVPESGLAHQITAPMPLIRTRCAASTTAPTPNRSSTGEWPWIDLRRVPCTDGSEPTRARVWCRVLESLPDDPLVRACTGRHRGLELLVRRALDPRPSAWSTTATYSPPSITQCGSTDQCPTRTGSSTTSSRPRQQTGAAWPRATSTAATARCWPPLPRRVCSAL